MGINLPYLFSKVLPYIMLFVGFSFSIIMTHSDGYFYLLYYNIMMVQALFRHFDEQKIIYFRYFWARIIDNRISPKHG